RSVQAPAANRMSKMDKMYHYTIQQEVLNEQAASLSCDLMNYLVENNIDINDQTNPVAILLIQLLALKRSLIDETSDDDAVLEGVRRHFEYISEFVGRLNRSKEVA
ncbi:MAG: hypothetical protein J5818_07220, partial [Eggerthellaceae bacterium]|nr:hypothetical protein [Eggerthellaceae bacterium]